MKAFRWEGAPGRMTLLRLFGVHVYLTRWNNLDGHVASRRWTTAFCAKVGPVSMYRRDHKGQVITQLRRFKVGRRSLYLGVSWGYR